MTNVAGVATASRSPALSTEDATKGDFWNQLDHDSEVEDNDSIMGGETCTASEQQTPLFIPQEVSSDNDNDTCPSKPSTNYDIASSQGPNASQASKKKRRTLLRLLSRKKKETSFSKTASVVTPGKNAVSRGFSFVRVKSRMGKEGTNDTIPLTPQSEFNQSTSTEGGYISSALKDLSEILNFDDAAKLVDSAAAYVANNACFVESDNDDEEEKSNSCKLWMTLISMLVLVFCKIQVLTKIYDLFLPFCITDHCYVCRSSKMERCTM